MAGPFMVGVGLGERPLEAARLEPWTITAPVPIETGGGPRGPDGRHRGGADDHKTGRRDIDGGVVRGPVAGDDRVPSFLCRAASVAAPRTIWCSLRSGDPTGSAGRSRRAGR